MAEPVSDDGQPISLDAALDLLAHGEIEVQGLMPWSSNYTFLILVVHGELQAPAVYKPCKGERPLWDFPAGTLAYREVAAHLVSEALGWMLVPPTVLRDGPHGPGMVQFYIHADPDDRKAGHCLRDKDDHIWAIDHGICFHEEPKLRTVIWEFGGQKIPAGLLRDLRAFRRRLDSRSDPVTKSLGDLLAREEVEALRRRADQLIAQARFPSPSRYERHIPWPPV